MMGLAACGEGTDTAAPAAETTTAPATTAAEATTAAPAAGTADKAVCEQAEKAAKAFKKAVIVLAQSGEIAATDAKAMLTDFANGLTKVAEGADGEVATAVKANADAARKAAGAKDPVEASDSPEAAKAGKELNAACKAAGVTTNF